LQILDGVSNLIQTRMRDRLRLTIGRASPSSSGLERVEDPIDRGWRLGLWESDMISEKLQKSRAFIEAECVKTASAENLCRELKNVRIRRLFPSGTGANWEPAEFEPPLSRVGECMAQKAISSLRDRYALAAGEIATVCHDLSF
jgi:hypothetical protein